MDSLRGKILVNGAILLGGAVVGWYGPMLVFGGRPTGFQLVLFLIGVVILLSSFEHFGGLGQAASSPPAPNPSAINFMCPHCNRSTAAPREGAGRKGMCEHCRGVVIPPGIPDPNIVGFACCHCAMPLLARKEHAGKAVPCSACQKEITVPAA